MEVCKEDQEAWEATQAQALLTGPTRGFLFKEHPGMAPDKVFLRSLFMWVNSRGERGG